MRVLTISRNFDHTYINDSRTIVGIVVLQGLNRDRRASALSAVDFDTSHVNSTQCSACIDIKRKVNGALVRVERDGTNRKCVKVVDRLRGYNMLDI